MGKILSLKKIGQEVEKQKRLGKTVALITGCFNVLHIGHVKLFRFAKSKADIVVVGLDSDMSIKLSKGNGRPVNDQKTRLETLSDLKSIDLLFGINDSFRFDTQSAPKILRKITSIIRPTFLVTNPLVDSYWKEKLQRSKLFGAKLLLAKHRRKKAYSETIAKTLRQNFRKIFRWRTC